MAAGEAKRLKMTDDWKTLISDELQKADYEQSPVHEQMLTLCQDVSVG